MTALLSVPVRPHQDSTTPHVHLPNEFSSQRAPNRAHTRALPVSGNARLSNGHVSELCDAAPRGHFPHS